MNFVEQIQVLTSTDKIGKRRKKWPIWGSITAIPLLDSLRIEHSVGDCDYVAIKGAIVYKSKTNNIQSETKSM